MARESSDSMSFRVGRGEQREEGEIHLLLRVSRPHQVVSYLRENMAFHISAEFWELVLNITLGAEPQGFEEIHCFQYHTERDPSCPGSLSHMLTCCTVPMVLPGTQLTLGQSHRQARPPA